MSQEASNSEMSFADKIKAYAEACGISVKECLEKMVKDSRKIIKYRDEHQSAVQPDTENGGTGLHY
ncbi:MAG: hypothetical protein AAB778_03635 [Patescibacteria group bacterium]